MNRDYTLMLSEVGERRAPSRGIGGDALSPLALSLMQAGFRPTPEATVEALGRDPFQHVRHCFVENISGVFDRSQPSGRRAVICLFRASVSAELAPCFSAFRLPLGCRQSSLADEHTTQNSSTIAAGSGGDIEKLVTANKDAVTNWFGSKIKEIDTSLWRLSQGYRRLGRSR